ncbi:glycosyltransferase family 87 protein [Nocardioides sp. SYSU DS0663]|uniref:glycosyltransferase family 87 protein n=1 Tax=Nocardioides sp. SYSU DS0663 TaxID=3416445 RepID=UPI003F4C4AE2
MSHVHPTREDPVVAALSDGVGGPMGDRAAGHRWWSPLRVVLLVTAACFALGMVQKSACVDDTWSAGQQYSHMCYSDLPFLYTDRGLAERAWPYSGDEDLRARYRVMEYPVGISYWAWGTAWVAQWADHFPGLPDLDERSGQAVETLFGTEEIRSEIWWYVVVNALGLGALALLTAWFLSRTHRRRPWDAMVFAASPVLALTALVNWDLLAVVLVAAATWAWSRDRPLLTGVLIGLGTATKLYPMLLLGAVLVICLRERRIRELGHAVAGALIAWVLANLPALLTGAEQWRVFWSFNSERGADLGSLWLVLQQATGTTITPHTINLWSWGLLGLWCLGVLVLGLRAPETPRLAQLAFLVVAGFLLVNKVYSPQYVLWLLPLAALAVPRWRDQLVWQATEVVYFASVWWYLGEYLTPAGGGDAGFYWLAIVLRVAGELYLVGIVVRDVLRPRHDTVRRAEWVAPPPPRLAG